MFRDFEEMLQRLPVVLRTAFVLAEMEGLSYEEIATIERTPVGTIKSRIHRARRKLQSLCGKAMEHP